MFDGAMALIIVDCFEFVPTVLTDVNIGLIVSVFIRALW